jgi:anti-sigma regulatory factor (Ser/Thr protein kinase)
MNADFSPATPGPLHPLEYIADAPQRNALARLLASRRDNILAAGLGEYARREAPSGRPLPAELYGAVFDALLDLLHAGTLDTVDTLFVRAVEQSDPVTSLFDVAASLRLILSTTTIAAVPAVLEGSDGAGAGRDVAALLLSAMDLKASRLHATLTRTVLREITAERERQMQFYQEVARMATNGCLRLVEPQEMPTPQGDPLPIREPVDASRIRRRALRVAESAGMPSSRAEDFSVAVGEAMSNVLKHATSGQAHVWSTGDAAFVFVMDTGQGMTMEILPKALSPGWSSQPSLGMGFTVMMEMADALWLSTGESGTILCIEQGLTPPTGPLLQTLMLDAPATLG